MRIMRLMRLMREWWWLGSVPTSTAMVWLMGNKLGWKLAVLTKLVRLMRLVRLMTLVRLMMLVRLMRQWCC